jgi:hypothetical protein
MPSQSSTRRLPSRCPRFSLRRRPRLALPSDLVHRPVHCRTVGLRLGTAAQAAQLEVVLRPRHRSSVLDRGTRLDRTQGQASRFQRSRYTIRKRQTAAKEKATPESSRSNHFGGVSRRPYTPPATRSTTRVRLRRRNHTGSASRRSLRFRLNDVSTAKSLHASEGFHQPGTASQRIPQPRHGSVPQVIDRGTDRTMARRYRPAPPSSLSLTTETETSHRTFQALHRFHHSRRTSLCNAPFDP